MKILILIFYMIFDIYQNFRNRQNFYIYYGLKYTFLEKLNLLSSVLWFLLQFSYVYLDYINDSL